MNKLYHKKTNKSDPKNVAYYFSGVESVAPLIGVLWGITVVYTAPSLWDDECFKHPGKLKGYFYKSLAYNGKPLFMATNKNKSCIGGFASLLSGKERRVFMQNAGKIISLIGVDINEEVVK